MPDYKEQTIEGKSWARAARDGARFRLCSNSSNDKTELIKWNKKAKSA